ncbi:MAG TPA: hypothetical protein VNU92_01235 [Edaphobacter sp.]|jgi:hypothetical protein|nr:hypothetical protein [Edaphobacter sp.]
MRLGRLVLIGVVCSGAACAVWAEDAKAITAEEILERMQARNAARQAALEHYSSERTYRVEYRGTGGTHAGEIVVHAEYSAPERR